MNKSDQAEHGRVDRGCMPLRGRTILITRASGQSAETTARLEALGATVIHCPTIEIVPPGSWAPLDASIDRIKAYDWIVFTSANGVRFFIDRLREKRGDVVGALEGRQICAIGPATAHALDEVGSVAQIVASDSKAEGALGAIVKHVGGEDQFRGLRFLIPRARVARKILPLSLRKLGAHVDTVETYQTVKPDVDGQSIIRLFKEQSIDAITFTSSSTVSNFAELVGLKDLSVLLTNTLVVCIGPITADTASRHGLKKIIQPEVYNSTALVDSIVESLGRD